MLRRFLKSSFVVRIFAFLAACYIRLVFMTCTWNTLGKEIPESYIQSQKPFIVCFWHGRLGMLACAWTWKKRPFHMLLSAHRDGRFIGQTVAHFRIQAIWGSTQRGGGQAFREMLKVLRQGGTVGITPDGPRGPNQIASLGIITLAKVTNVDIIPITFSTSHHRRFKTWDRFHFPFPFGRGIFLWGPPLHPPAANGESDKEEARQRLEIEMTKLQDKADQIMGLI